MHTKQMNNYKKNKRPTQSSSLSAFAFSGLVIAALFMGACAPRVAVRGNAINIEDVATIKIGSHTRNSVFELLGSPSNQSSFGEETWYYISQLTETTAFLAAEVKERQVVMVKFDNKGVVSFVDVIDTNQAQAVIPAEGATPTAGNSLSFVDQILSNLGRFNKK